MSFIEIGRRFINTCHIKCVIRPLKDDGSNTIIELADGDQIEALPGVWRRFENMTEGQVVVALPGFSLLSYWGNGDTSCVDRLSIIAWIIEPGGMEWAALPVTVDGIPSDSNNWAVIQPDGVVICRGDRSWASYEDWLAEVSKKKISEVTS